MDPKSIHELEQAVQGIKEQFCPVVYSIYRGFVDAGFSDAQALDLTKAWMVVTLNRPTAR